MRTIDVDAHGRDAEGNSYDNTAAPESVAAGYLINEPVILRYPNGRLARANEVQVTPCGLEWLRRVMPLDARNIGGSA